MSYIGIVASFVLVENLVLSRLLGLCPFVAASRSRGSAMAVGSATLFVGSLAGIATWAVNRLVLVPLKAEVLQIVAFMLLVAAASRLLESLVRAASPVLHAVLGPHIEHTMTNSAVLGVCLVAANAGYGVMQSFVAGLAGAGGFFLAEGIMASIGGKLELEWVPRPLQGAPIALISAALLAMAFLAFDGIVPAAV
jgi:Na+-translocating ferredoxin:NAD+ oxidoreductase subunit A